MVAEEGGGPAVAYEEGADALRLDANAGLVSRVRFTGLSVRYMPGADLVDASSGTFWRALAFLDANELLPAFEH